MIAHIYVDWRLTSATKFQFMELINMYEQVEEDSDEAEAIKESIKSLPGFPVTAPIDSDFLLVVTDTQN